jgi:hypothetical protein
VLLHQEHRGGEGRCTWAYDALLEHSGALGFKLIFLKLWIPVGPHRNRGRVGQEVYTVVTLSHRRQALGRGEDVLE